MTNEEVGAYIRCLCVQASKGGISEKHMRNICGTHDTHMIVKEKFSAGEDSLFFNVRLKLEIEKRKAFSESRRLNRSKPNKSDSHMKNTSESYVTHMENENENEIEDVIKKVPKEKFTPPTPDQVTAFVKEKLPNAPDIFCKSFAEKFCGHYESVGWKVGKNPMKSWEGAVNKWSPTEAFQLFQEKNKSHKQFNTEKTKL